MKLMMKTAIAAVALISAPAAFAQTANGTYHSAAPDPGRQVTTYHPLDFWHLFPQTETVGAKTAAQQFADGIGSQFKQSAAVAGDIGTASAAESANKQTFQLSGTVNKDCSFYDGGSATHNVALNTIGVRTNSTDNVSQAFNQVADLTVAINTATAGCNTKNKVVVSSFNKGKLVNGAAGGFDEVQFTDNIPYSFSAKWQGVSAGGKGQAATQQEIKWTNTAAAGGTGSVIGGAWRSAFSIDITAPAQSKGLVAGTYDDTITVTLAAEA